ncbi:hydrogenase maturation protease [Brevibacillus massiliensis]|uniref:hydrogenase maturation protease n=1 Tax=Brevibacillus massiliensis TaxID=1118054 RepID=UPI00036C2805|nr:hydrogenase maturation protease [Brevibacillus massiliensis]
MKKIVVIGIGNILMMDDGIGVYLVEELAKSLPLPNVEYVVGETDLDYCMEVAVRADTLIVIDAVVTGKQAGTVSRFSLQEGLLMDKGISMHSLHFLDELVLSDHPRERLLIGVESAEIKFNIGLSSTMQEKFSDTLYRVAEMIKDMVLTSK